MGQLSTEVFVQLKAGVLLSGFSVLVLSWASPAMSQSVTTPLQAQHLAIKGVVSVKVVPDPIFQQPQMDSLEVVVRVNTSSCLSDFPRLPIVETRESGTPPEGRVFTRVRLSAVLKPGIQHCVGHPDRLVKLNFGLSVSGKSFETEQIRLLSGQKSKSGKSSVRDVVIEMTSNPQAGKILSYRQIQ